VKCVNSEKELSSGSLQLFSGLGSVWVLAHFLLTGSVLGKTWVLVRFVLAKFGFFRFYR